MSSNAPKSLSDWTIYALPPPGGFLILPGQGTPPPTEPIVIPPDTQPVPPPDFGGGGSPPYPSHPGSRRPIRKVLLSQVGLAFPETGRLCRGCRGHLWEARRAIRATQSTTRPIPVTQSGRSRRSIRWYRAGRPSLDSRTSRLRVVEERRRIRRIPGSRQSVLRARQFQVGQMSLATGQAYQEYQVERLRLRRSSRPACTSSLERRLKESRSERS